MNVISYILLALVIAAFIYVARYYFSGHGRKSCCDQCQGCHGQCGKPVK